MQYSKFRLSSVVSSFIVMAFGVFVYWCVVVPILPRMAEMYGQCAVVCTNVTFAALVLVYGFCILARRKLVGYIKHHK